MINTLETLSGLRGRSWKADYGPADDPLTSFYVPALERSVRYERIAGFFSSAALSVAAQGIASMIARGGRMRLLAGAQLSQNDVDAILRGIELGDALSRKFRRLLTDPTALADHLVRRRLEVLAWLAANDRLDIRIVVEADPQTRSPDGLRRLFPRKDRDFAGRGRGRSGLHRQYQRDRDGVEKQLRDLRRVHVLG